jgi:hypothetical protein
MKKASCYGLVVVALSTGLTSCANSDAPGPAYRLTADELAWQAYEQGQQLRFGRAGSSQVRSYLVSEVSDQMEQQYQSVWIASVQGQPPTFQHIKVSGYRTDSLEYTAGGIANPRDSVRTVYTFLDLQKYAVKGSPSTIMLLSKIGWDYWSTTYPPLQEIINNQPLLAGGPVTLLPSVTLGGIAYGPTLLITRNYSLPVSPRQHIVSCIWYARGKGVVGYEEVGAGVWYRLP